MMISAEENTRAFLKSLTKSTTYDRPEENDEPFRVEREGEEIPFEDLREGDTFAVFYPDGEPYKGPVVATSDPKPTIEGHHYIQQRPIKLSDL